MRIGLISDTHDNRHTVEAALTHFRDAQITTVLHAGDVTNVPTLKLLADFDLWIARGNVDHDPQLLSTARELFGPGRLLNAHSLTFDGMRIALTHGHSWQRLTTLIRDSGYRYVIHGHTHVPNDETVGTVRVINPGALGNSRWRCATCAVLDLATDALEWIEL